MDAFNLMLKVPFSNVKKSTEGGKEGAPAKSPHAMARVKAVSQNEKTRGKENKRGA